MAALFRTVVNDRLLVLNATEGERRERVAKKEALAAGGNFMMLL